MSTTTRTPDSASGRPHRTGRWIDDWRPEDPEFWESTGKPIARRNLIWSIFAEHLGFSIWMIWSVSSAFLTQVGFDFSAQQLFLLVSIPSLVGAILRMPYTFAVPKFGGRNFTLFSAIALLVPTGGYAIAVTNPGTPFWMFCVIAAFAGLGGGNFASSMTNINFFFPAHAKGTALGLNAAGGNIGVAIIQLLLPALVGGSAFFGLVSANESIHLEYAAYFYAALCAVATFAAWRWMDNLTYAKGNPREQFSVLTHKHTWIMSVIYIGTFGSFMGYASSMPLLIKLNFWVPDGGALGTGIYFAYFAFLGAGVGSLTRPVGGWLADRFGGARITLYSIVGIIAFTLAVVWTLGRLRSNPDQTAAIAADNQSWFPLFLGCYLMIFAFTGIGNGSAYKMIPAIFKREAEADTAPGTPERELAVTEATKKSSSALGFVGAMGALGGFLIPLAFSAPWVGDPLSATKGALLGFVGYYVLCALICWGVYMRIAPGSTSGNGAGTDEHDHELATTRI